jgi:hypothetical protein
MPHLASPDNLTRPVNPGDDYPKHIEVRVGDEIKKFPITYLEKRVLKVGKFTHPKTKEEFTISSGYLDDLVLKTNQMIAAGFEIPTPIDHLDDHVARPKNPYFVSGKDNLGFVVKATREGNYLHFIQAAIGEDAALTALRNRSSVYIKPFTDSTGKNWGSVVVHSAYTPIPALGGLGAPTPLSREGVEVLELSREEENSMKLSEAQRKRLVAIAIRNGVKKEDAEKMDDAILQEEGVKYLEKLPDSDPADIQKQLDTTKTELETTKKELTTAQSRETDLKQQLSKEKPEAPTAREQKNARRTAEERVDAAVIAKKFSPAAGDFIKERIKEEPLRLTLARDDADDKPELFEDLMKVAELSAKAPVPGAAAKPDSKEKKLSRENPPDDKGDKEDETESERLTRLAKDAGTKFKKAHRQVPALSGRSSEAGED